VTVLLNCNFIWITHSLTLFRDFASRNLQPTRTTFVTYIRPILEYNRILWSPNLIYLIDLIESVQRKFIKRMNSSASWLYSNRLNLLNLQPLELRRLHLDLTNYYKIPNGLSHFTATDYFLIYSSITSTRPNMPSLLRHLNASSKLSSSFSFRSVDDWNHLPSNIKLLTSLNSFKSAIKLFDLSASLKCSYF